MKLQVECYAGRKADERPLRFHLGTQAYAVQEVLDQYEGIQIPAAKFVITGHGRVAQGAIEIHGNRKLGPAAPGCDEADDRAQGQ